ncbi:carboxylesterase family protein [Paenibacillus sp. strain BS8-2]
MQITNHSNTSLGFKLFIPEDYDSNTQYPLILFLHGIKKRGEDLSLLDNYGLIKHVSENTKFPFIIVAPQCPITSFWPEVKQEVLDIVSDIKSKFNVNKNKIYVMGFSMGGNGTWDMAATKGDVFSAAVPISGWYEQDKSHNINIPIWAFHCEDDDVVPISGTVNMVEALKGLDKEILFTRYSGLKHDHSVMYNTFSNKELFKWLLSKELQTNL